MTRKARLLTDSPNYRDGKFQNQSPTPTLKEGVPMWRVLRESLRRPKTVRPPQPLPAVTTDLKALHSEAPVVVWFGHSSYLIHCRGVNVLVDPVFSGHASPFRGMVKAFAGADAYGVEDMPIIDLLIITHNHYDHLDKETLAKLAPKVRQCCTPLGVIKDLDKVLQAETPITELDWWETTEPLPGISLTATPARHFSGRGLKRAGSLWASWVLELFGYRLYLGADSGYDKHFREIGAKYGPFDMAILECGQYNEAWPYIHMMPEETLKAALDLKAKALLPVHWAKFTLANHPWDEPVKRLLEAAKGTALPVATPRIGEAVVVGAPYPAGHWWEGV